MINKFYYPKGGAERHFFDLKKLLEDHGHQVVPLAMVDKNNFDTPYKKYFISRVETEKINWHWSAIKTIFRFFYSFEARRKIRTLIMEEKPDLVHFHNIYHQISPSILPIFKKFGLPVIMTVHDHKLVAPNYYLKNARGQICGQDHNFWQCIYKKCIKNSVLASLVCVLEFYFHQLIGYYRKYVDFYIVPSAYLANRLITAGYQKNKIIILPHFIESNKAGQNHVPAKNERELFVAYMGRLSSEKGLDTLFQALIKTQQKVRLKVIGSGELEKYRLLAANLKLTSRIEFISYPKDGKINELLEGCLAVVIPSLVPETFGLSVLEAYRFGKPVITTREGALPEIVTEGETGYMFESHDEKKLSELLDQVFSNKEVFLRLGEKAKNIVERDYNSENYYQHLIKLYQQLI